MEKSTDKLKLLKFPEMGHEERFTQILSEMLSMPDTIDERYYLETLILAIENHFDGLDGDHAFMVAFRARELRLVISDFYENL